MAVYKDNAGHVQLQQDAERPIDMVFMANRKNLEDKARVPWEGNEDSSSGSFWFPRGRGISGEEYLGKEISR